MLYKLFITQWNHCTAGDWTRQVKKDLDDFEISSDLNEIKSKSKYSFKKLVQSRAKEHALYKLLEKKQNHSKLVNLFYPELKIQNYLKLEKLSVEQAKTVFSFRCRMAQYSENYRNQSEVSTCPLCQLHLDNQPMSFKNCATIKENIQIKGKYEKRCSDDVKYLFR